LTSSRPATWNRYAYARNNPINRFDPDGRRDEYANYRSTKQAIVDAHRRYVSQTGTKVETGTAAYDTRSGGSKLIAGKPGKHVDSVKTAGPSSPEGKAEVAAGSSFRGEAHVHPSSSIPSISDLNVWRENNLAIGIEPKNDPDAAVDAYIVLPDGRVFQIAYGVPGEQVTTVEELEEQIEDGTEEAAEPEGTPEGKDTTEPEKKQTP
jgi:hypothetical protein